MPSGQPMEVRVFDATMATLVQDWTNTGVTEHVVDSGLGVSAYYYTATLNAGDAYIIDWRNGTTPTRVATETLSNTDTWNDASIAALGSPASQASVTALGSPMQAGATVDTNPVTLAASQPDYAPLLASGYTAPDNTDIAAIKTAVAAIPTNPLLTTDARLNDLDAAISSRLAASAYTAPDNTDIGAIKADVENATYGLNALLTAIQACLQAAAYVAPDNADIAAIKTAVAAIPTTPLLAANYTAPDNADITAIKGDVESATYGLNALLTAINSRLAAAGYTAPDNTDIAAIKAQTDKLQFDASDYVKSDPQSAITVGNVTVGGYASGQDPASLLLSAPANKLLTNSNGYVTATNGGGAASVVLPPIQGQVYTATAIEFQTVRVVQGDTPTITFNLGADYTGWTAEFGASLAPGGPLVMPVRNATWTDAALGQGNIALTAADTATPGSYYAELKLLNGSTVLTAIKFTVQVLPAVIS